jgi:molecular chaperone DnaK
MPQVEVTFDIDANGILNVQAKDLGTKKEQKITIKYSSGLSDAEVKKMSSEAEQYAADDHKRREVVDARNQADQLIYQTEKTLKEYGDRLSAPDKSKIEDAKKVLEEAVKGDNFQAIKSAMDTYVTAAQQLAKVMYENMGDKGGPTEPGPGPGPEPSHGQQPQGESEPPKKGPGGDDNIIDADYTVK